MKLRPLIGTAWIAIAISMRAESIKLDYLTVGSMTYSNVTVLGANASDLFFNSNRGIRNVKLRLLSPEMQKKFNYDPDAAARAEEQQAEDEQRYHDNLAAQMTADFNAARDAREAAAQAPYSQAGLADPVTADSPLGKTVPDLDVQQWIGTKPNMDGKPALISVWSPKSASCRKWIPALNDLSRNFSDKINVIGVTAATPAEVTQADPKIDFPCAIDSDGKFISGANITMFPCVLLLDTNRAIRYQGHPAALTAQILDNVLKQTTEQPSEQTTP